MNELIGVIRIRGWAATPWYIQDTLSMLRLKNAFNAMIYPKDSSIQGMLNLVSSYVTWGELNDEGLRLLVSKLEISKGKKVNEEYVKDKLNVDFQSFVESIKDGKLRLNKLNETFSLPIRLHPPKGGFKGKVSRPFRAGGEFGYRGDKINELIRRMV
ncbi:50S ribosomal protein L30 [Sulfolobus acidocaldarius SUSAZ]|nr:50S ribosomal protein L30 [Sulfolobus acidocaldarius SUSAZ]